MPIEKPKVAVFDFDETLTHCDTLLPFLRFAVGKRKTYLALLRLIPLLIQYPLKLASRQTIKEAILSACIGGLSENYLRQTGADFAQSCIPKLLKSHVMARLQWHLQQNHRCILVSGAIDIYLQPWGKSAQFHHVISTNCAVDNNGIITGKLEGENCWGTEKMRRLAEFLGPREGYVLYAYGDSKGDAALLSAADYPYYRY